MNKLESLNLIEPSININYIVQFHTFTFKLGAGTAVPTVRCESERAFTDQKWTADFIRINPLVEHSMVDDYYKKKSNGKTIEIALDALTASQLIDEAIMKISKH
ncbi:unnamed protein product [Adineta steineri]|uniref:Uncharacterized protein n=1 Tax=Adineta steineri TaxID=433720 RepID=A0A813XAU7_9BILA|nr:unnamed protein product [Adineta steineri]